MNKFRLTKISVHESLYLFTKTSPIIFFCTVIFRVMFGFAVNLLCIHFSFLGMKEVLLSCVALPIS